jgi:hypothetical protein
MGLLGKAGRAGSCAIVQPFAERFSSHEAKRTDEKRLASIVRKNEAI